MSLHALDRARERYGVSLTFGDLSAIVAMIEAGQAALVSRAEEHVFRYLVQYQGTRFKVVYDAKRRDVVTFLKMNERERPREREKAERVRFVKRKGKRFVAGPARWVDGLRLT